MDAHADLGDAEFIKAVNRIFHEEEAAVYDACHPEILERERTRWHALARFLPKKENGLRLLDIGTGTGFVPEVLSVYFASKDTLVLTDLSLSMLKLARSKLLIDGAPPRLVFVAADAERLPFPASQFDVVTANSVLHHLPDIRSFLGEVDRVLRVGGLLIVVHEPNRAFFSNPFLHMCQWIVWKYNGLRLRLRRSRTLRETPASVYANVNKGLRERGLIGEDLSPHEIQSYVDFHSPAASGRVCTSKGFDLQAFPEHNLSGYSMVFFTTYNYLDIVGLPSRAVAFAQHVLEIVFPRSGSFAAAVYEKGS